MVADIKYKSQIISVTKDGFVSITRTPFVVQEDGTEKLGRPKTVSFVPGNFQQVAAFAPDLLPEINKIWTPELVQMFRVRQNAINDSIDNPQPESLEDAKIMKRSEIDLACEEALALGFGVPELNLHFTLDIYDQVSLSGLTLLSTKSPYVPFYDGISNDCRLFTTEEFFLITTHASIFLTYHRTRRKQLFRMIEDFTEINQVMEINYEMELTGRYLERMLEIMSVFNPLKNPDLGVNACEPMAAFIG